MARKKINGKQKRKELSAMNQRGLQNLITYLYLVNVENRSLMNELWVQTRTLEKEEESSKLELFSYERSFNIQNWRQLKKLDGSRKNSMKFEWKFLINGD